MLHGSLILLWCASLAFPDIQNMIHSLSACPSAPAPVHQGPLRHPLLASVVWQDFVVVWRHSFVGGSLGECMACCEEMLAEIGEPEQGGSAILGK